MKWPTLKARLDNALTSNEEALRQLKTNEATLSPLAEKLLKKYENRQKKARKDSTTA